MRSLVLAALVASSAAANAQQTSLRLSRGPAPAGKVAGWFSAMDRLLASFAEVEAIAFSSAARAPSAGDCRALAKLARSMAQDYLEVSGERAPAELEADAAALEKAVGASPDGRAAPDAAARQALSLGPGGVYRWTQLMRQGALDAMGPKGELLVQSQAVLSREGAPPRVVSVLDLLPSDPAPDSPPPSLAALAALAGALPDEELSVALSARLLWLRVRRAELFADLSPPLSGGVVRLRYRELGLSVAERARLLFLAQALFEGGFSVALQGGRLEASEEAGAGALEQAFEPAIYAAKAAATAAQLSGPLAGYLKGASGKEREEKVAYLARVFAAEGELPFPMGAEPARFGAAVEAYRKGEPEREAARARMDKALAALGLGTFPASEPVGRRTMALRYERAIEAAAARGEIAAEKGSARRVSYEPVLRLAERSPEPGLGDLEGVPERDELVGLLGGLPVWRAQWRLGPDDWLTIVRSGSGASARASALRGSAARRAELSPSRALALLRARGLLPRLPAASRAPAPSESPGVRAQLRFAPAAPRRFDGVLTYDAAKALGPRDVYATPALTPADAARLAQAKGFLVTRAPAEAAALGLAAGKPGLGLARARWTAAGLELLVPEFGPPRYVAGLSVRGVARASLRILREGDSLALDADSGSLRTLKPEPAALGLPASGAKQPS